MMINCTLIWLWFALVRKTNKITASSHTFTFNKFNSFAYVTEIKNLKFFIKIVLNREHELKPFVWHYMAFNFMVYVGRYILLLVWQFNTFLILTFSDVVPDILTLGKQLGNGYPMSLVVTTKEISDSLREFSSTVSDGLLLCSDCLVWFLDKTLLT